MASSYPKSAYAALFLALNLVLFACGPAAATEVCQPNLLGGCGSLLGLVGSPATQPCCSLFPVDITDLQAAECLCAAIKANVLGVVANADIAISIILGHCGRKFPPTYTCA